MSSTDCVVVGVVRVRSGDATGALHDDLVPHLAHADLAWFAPGGAERDGDAEPVEFPDVPVDQRSVRARDPGDTAELRVALDDGHVVAADRRDPGGLEAGRAATDHHHRAGRARRLVPVGILGLATARRFADARHDRVARIAHLTRLVASGAGPDAIVLVPRQLRHEVGVGDLGAGHLHAVAERRVVVTTECPLGLTDVDDRPLEDHRDVDRRVHRSAHVDVEPGRFVEVGPRLLGREDRPARHDQVVDAGTGPVRARAMSGAMSGVIPAHGASSSHDSRNPTIRSAPAPSRAAAITRRANSRRS